ncbi:hypothetical protein FIV42_24525 [Persicimonas caeni]|uniref:TerB family tellurite resistance protein n=1 Tax=Persicimonas caeni TaxID=2292766 RepID=A0A4Y6PZU0_PERCE|nr:hypothetical protein [Persicimonas caeni]QDG53792.1 hypothetical protein FIV42_24525 [Persicimonas caeni]QED35013.1 hypothetical protein FRD00_24520 [Persicimonas caeni]
MSIITALSNLFSGRSFSKISAEQEKAMIDALTYAMAVDREIAGDEQKELTSSLRHVKWEEEIPLESYVSESVARAKRISAQPGDAPDYLHQISERLGEDWLREETYYLAARIAASDRDIVSAEQLLLSNMVQAFELDNDTQARIADQLMRETDF